MKTPRSPRLRGEKKWLEPNSTSAPKALQAAIGGHPLVAQTLAQLGITDPDAARAFLDPHHYTPTPASELPGLIEAADLIEHAIQAGETILVWGDFDVDGQTSTTLLVEALRALGAKVTYYIPVRATEGHGIKVDKLSAFLSSESSPIPALLLTCDTGIAEHKAVEFAKSRGLTVVITDHHDLPPTLPNADAIVNSKLLPEGHPLSTLPGVGVAYKLVEELYDWRRTSKDGDRPSSVSGLQSAKHLDLVALGIVADVALQTGDARYLLQRGLDVLRRTQRLGLQTLYKSAEIIPDQLTEETIGFSIGPRLNALGRLSNANPIVEFLTTEDPSQANVIAAQLEGLNDKRRLLTDQIYKAALTQIEREPELLNFAALVLAHPHWPPGVIGIVASRLVERFNKPTILLSAPEGEPARGSARSVEGVHITEAIAAQSEMLLGFGGHPMAAGLSLDAQHIPDFRQGLSRTIRTMTTDVTEEPSLSIDAYIPLSHLDLDLVEDLERLAPFGAGNPTLTLASRDLNLVSHTLIGRSRQHLRLVVEDQEGVSQEFLWWRGAGEEIPQTNFDLAYNVRTNTFRGQRRVQAQWLDYRQSAETTTEVISEAPVVDLVDCRDETHPLALLDDLKSQGEFLLFTEGEAKRRLGGRDRLELAPAETLILWTPPPGPWELQTLFEAVSPQQAYLFNINPGLDSHEDFLARLAGLVKHTLKAKNGLAQLPALAAAMSHRETTVRLGLAWLEEKGHIRAERGTESEEYHLSADGEPGLALNDVAMTLKTLLDETSAYRSYLKSADINSLAQTISMQH